MKKDVILFQAQRLDPINRRTLRKLVRDLAGFADIYVTGFNPKKTEHPEFVDGIRYIEYDREALLRLPYPKKADPDNWKLMPGNTDLLLLSFWREHPDYDYYWVIEYDVRYTGNWLKLLEQFHDCRADLLATHIARFDEVPKWEHWETLKVPDEVIWRDHAIKIFTPICRMSKKTCEAVDAAARAGWGGHSESLWATVAAYHGLRIEDIGGFGSFTPEERRGKHYTKTSSLFPWRPGSFVYRPIRSFAPPVPNRLWHPIKAQPFLVRHKKLGRIISKLKNRVSSAKKARAARAGGKASTSLRGI